MNTQIGRILQHVCKVPKVQLPKIKPPKLEKVPKVVTCLACGTLRHPKSTTGLCKACMMMSRRSASAERHLKQLTELRYVVHTPLEDLWDSRSKVDVTNLECGHRFTANIANVIGRLSKCGVCGPQKRVQLLIERNRLGLSEQSKMKSKATKARRRAERTYHVKLKNEILENSVLLEGPEALSNFLSGIVEKSKSSSKKFIKRVYPKIYEAINVGTGLPFGEQLYNLMNKTLEKPKCKVCSGSVAFVQASYGYSTYYSYDCKNLDYAFIDEKRKR